MRNAKMNRFARFVLPCLSAMAVMTFGEGMLSQRVMAEDGAIADVEAAKEALQEARARARAEVEPDLKKAEVASKAARDAYRGMEREIERAWNEGVGKERVDAYEAAREAYRVAHDEASRTSDVVAEQRHAYQEAQAALQAGMTAALEADEGYNQIMTDAEALYKELAAAFEAKMKAEHEELIKDLHHHMHGALKDDEARDKAREEQYAARSKRDEANAEIKRLKDALLQRLRNDLRAISDAKWESDEIRALRDAERDTQRNLSTAVNEMPDVAALREAEKSTKDAMETARDEAINAAIAADPAKVALRDAQEAAREAVRVLEDELRAIKD